MPNMAIRRAPLLGDVGTCGDGDEGEGEGDDEDCCC